MNRTDFKNYYLSSSQSEKARLLRRFAFDLTIVGRETYEAQTERLADPVRLRGINELQHRVLSRLVSLGDGLAPASDEESSFVAMVMDLAKELHCDFAISESLKWCRGRAAVGRTGVLTKRAV